MSLNTLRDKYGDSYISLVGEIEIPWKPLSMQDWIQYDKSFVEGRISSVVLEEEIFKKCVLDNTILANYQDIPAGTISIVAQNIMSVSGPTGIEQFNNMLETNRSIIEQNFIHQLVPTIIRAFPAYTPEDVYAMNYDQFMFRLVQAEFLLTALGIQKEPISIIDESKKKRRKAPQVDLKKAWEQQSKPTKKKPPDDTRVDFSAIPSPIFKEKGEVRKMKGLDKDRIETENFANSADENTTRAQMIRDAQIIYGDTIKNMAFYQKKPSGQAK